MSYVLNKLGKVSAVWLPIVMMLIITACGGEGTTSQSSGSELSGDIEIDGSSTVFLISAAMAEIFREESPRVQVPVGISGTGGGFKRFVTGETDISNASRPIGESEREQAAENGIEFIELIVAFDGLSVVVSSRNNFVECLTVEDLRQLWVPGSTITNWNEVREDFPSEEIRLFGPDADSGTFDYFTGEIVGSEGASRQDYSPSADDNVIVQGVKDDSLALAYFGYAYYIENADTLRTIGIDDGEGCIYPSVETIGDGSYSPLSRPLFIYVNKASLERPEVRSFVEFYLENAGRIAGAVGYIGLSQMEYEEQLDTVRNALQ